MDNGFTKKNTSTAIHMTKKSRTISKFQDYLPYRRQKKRKYLRWLMKVLTLALVSTYVGTCKYLR